MYIYGVVVEVTSNVLQFQTNIHFKDLHWRVENIFTVLRKPRYGWMLQYFISKTFTIHKSIFEFDHPVLLYSMFNKYVRVTIHSTNCHIVLSIRDI